MPISIFVLVTLTALVLISRGRTLGKWMLLLAGLWFLLISTSPLPEYLIKHLEEDYHQFSFSDVKGLDDPINIIVLGAGFSDDPALSSNNRLSLRALGRLIEGVRIYRVCPGKSDLKVNLILSGWNGRMRISQAELYRMNAIMLGVDSIDIGMLTDPSNTRMEADEYFRKYGSGKPVILVTDAVHMRRAVKIFSDTGLHVIPAPANFLYKKSSVVNPLRWVPSADNIGLIEIAVHEYAGILWHKAGGK